MFLQKCKALFNSFLQVKTKLPLTDKNWLTIKVSTSALAQNYEKGPCKYRGSLFWLTKMWLYLLQPNFKVIAGFCSGEDTWPS